MLPSCKQNYNRTNHLLILRQSKFRLRHLIKEVVQDVLRFYLDRSRKDVKRRHTAHKGVKEGRSDCMNGNVKDWLSGLLGVWSHFLVCFLIFLVINEFDLNYYIYG